MVLVVPISVKASCQANVNSHLLQVSSSELVVALHIVLSNFYAWPCVENAGVKFFWNN